MRSSLFITLVAGICLFKVQYVLAETLSPINVYSGAETYSTKVSVQGKDVLGLKSWSQALSQLPGAYVYNDGGLKLSFEGGFSHQISVIVDGVLIEDSSSPNKTFNFNSLSLDTVKSIKVLSAAESSFKTGSPFVVEIETYGANQLRLEGGSHGFAAAELQMQNKKSKSYLKLESVDGVSAASGDDLENDGRKSFYASYDKKNKYGLRASITDDEIDRGAGALNDDPSYTLKQEQYGGYLKGRFKGVSLDSSINYNKRKSVNKKDKASVDYQASKYESINLNQTALGRLYNLNYKLSAFYEEADVDSNFNGFKSKINNKKNYSGRLAFLKSIKKNKSLLNLSLWGDYDNLISKNMGYAVSAQQQIGLLEFSAGYNRGLKKPTLSQLFDPNYGNEELSEEVNHSFDMSLTGYFDRFNVKTYYKKQNIDELISFDSLTFRSKNIAKAKLESMGLELKTSGKKISAGLGGDYILKAIDGEGDRLNRRPQWSVSGFVSAKIQKSISAGLLYKNIGSRYDGDLINFNKKVKLKNYKHLDLYLEKSWSQNKAYLRLNNMLNDKTESINGYTMPGTEVFVGLIREL